MAKKRREKPLFFCRDCYYATDFHEKNYEGEYFLCKCKFFPFSRFLNRDYCENFKMKQ